MSFGYQVQPVLNVNFDVDHSIQQEVPCGKKVKEKEENIFVDLELEELQQLQVKYGHEASTL